MYYGFLLLSLGPIFLFLFCLFHTAVVELVIRGIVVVVVVFLVQGPICHVVQLVFTGDWLVAMKAAKWWSNASIHVDLAPSVHHEAKMAFAHDMVAWAETVIAAMTFGQTNGVLEFVHLFDLGSELEFRGKLVVGADLLVFVFLF